MPGSDGLLAANMAMLVGLFGKLKSKGILADSEIQEIADTALTLLEHSPDLKGSDVDAARQNIEMLSQVMSTPPATESK